MNVTRSTNVGSKNRLVGSPKNQLSLSKSISVTATKEKKPSSGDLNIHLMTIDNQGS